MNITAAVNRLNTQLPLKARQDELTVALKTVHQTVLMTLVAKGRVPELEELKSILGNDVEEGIRRLGTDDLLVLDSQGVLPVGAYPLTIENTPHQISLNGHTIHAMCALDAVSVAPMFGTDVTIESSCHVSHTPILIRMRDSDILEVVPSTDVTVGIRWQKPSAVAAHSMCMEMVFLKDSKTAEVWQEDDIENISLFTLPEAVAFGKAFFLPLLEG